MDTIKLDLRNLLGFKLVADGGSTVSLTSPKIGDKTCQVLDEETARTLVAAGAALAAKVGSKSD